MNKVFSSAEEVIADISDGSTIMFGGFGVTGIPATLIKALSRRGTRNITAITNSAGGKLSGTFPGRFSYSSSTAS